MRSFANSYRVYKKNIEAGQENVLPGHLIRFIIFPAFPGRDELDIYASMNPAKEVGGDFYDFLWWSRDTLPLL